MFKTLSLNGDGENAKLEVTLIPNLLTLVLALALILNLTLSR